MGCNKHEIPHGSIYICTIDPSTYVGEPVLMRRRWLWRPRSARCPDCQSLSVVWGLWGFETKSKIGRDCDFCGAKASPDRDEREKP